MPSYYYTKILDTTSTTCKHPCPADAMKKKKENKNEKRETKIKKETEKGNKQNLSSRKRTRYDRLHTGLDAALDNERHAIVQYCHAII